MILGTYALHSPEWHKARRWRVGGSEVAQILGWSPYGDRDALLASKLEPVDKPPTPAQLRGTALEDGVLHWGELAKGYAYDPGPSAATHVHPVFDWALYNPDAITTDGLLIEVKTTSDRSTERGWGRAGTDQIPVYYRAQVAHGMAVCDLPEARLLCLHGATNGRPDLNVAEYRIKRDRALENRLLAAARDFHRQLIAARDTAAAA